MTWNLFGLLMKETKITEVPLGDTLRGGMGCGTVSPINTWGRAGRSQLMYDVTFFNIKFRLLPIAKFFLLPLN